jgi:hypothetical protein
MYVLEDLRWMLEKRKMKGGGWWCGIATITKNCQRNIVTLFGQGGAMLPSLVRLSFCGESSRASAPDMHLVAE